MAAGDQVSRLVRSPNSKGVMTMSVSRRFMLGMATVALSALDLVAQATEGIALPSLMLRIGNGPWIGSACPQPSAWGMPTTQAVTAGALVTLRLEFFAGPFTTAPCVIAMAPSFGSPTRYPGFLEGPVLLDPAVTVLLAVGLPGPVSPTTMPCSYGNQGLEITSAATLPIGMSFGLQAVAGQFVSLTTSPLLVVQVQ